MRRSGTKLSQPRQTFIGNEKKQQTTKLKGATLLQRVKEKTEQEEENWEWNWRGRRGGEKENPVSVAGRAASDTGG